MIKAILFDKDGTLVDTEKYYLESYLRTFEQLGHPITKEQALGFRSLGKPFVYDFVRNISDGTLTWGDIRPVRTEILTSLFAEKGIELKPFAGEALSALKKKGCTLAIVTATNAEDARAQLEHLGILQYFDRILSAHNVPEGKPAPDVYLEACRQLSLDPSETIAVEDSPNGALSAIRAGCNTVMIPDLTEPDEELKKRLFSVESDLYKLPDLI